MDDARHQYISSGVNDSTTATVKRLEAERHIIAFPLRSESDACSVVRNAAKRRKRTQACAMVWIKRKAACAAAFLKNLSDFLDSGCFAFAPPYHKTEEAKPAAQ